VVGINTAIRAGADGIGFAIPVAALRDVLGQLKEKGYVERGKLGLAFQPITPALANALRLDRARGALVSEVASGSSAAKAGIQAGDVIVAVNGSPIRRAEELPRNVARHAPGASIEVELLREGATLTLRATLDKLEDDDGGPPPPRRNERGASTKSELLGIEVEDLPGGGVRVTSLTKPLKDLQPGDIIVEMNGEGVRDVADLRGKLKRLDPKGTALLRVRRGDHQRYVGVPLSQ
jgi:serine protease Do